MIEARLNIETPETDTEASMTHLDCDDSCVEIYIKRDGKNAYGDIVLADFARSLEQKRNDALAALEREQMRLVACDVIAMCDTPESAADARHMHQDYESAALDSVKRRVDECIALRHMARELRDALQELNDAQWLNLPGRAGEIVEVALTKAKEVLP